MNAPGVFGGRISAKGGGKAKAAMAGAKGSSSQQNRVGRRNSMRSDEMNKVAPCSGEEDNDNFDEEDNNNWLQTVYEFVLSLQEDPDFRLRSGLSPNSPATIVNAELPDPSNTKRGRSKIEAEAFFLYLRSKGLVDDDARVFPVRVRAKMVLEGQQRGRGNVGGTGYAARAPPRSCNVKDLYKIEEAHELRRAASSEMASVYSGGSEHRAVAGVEKGKPRKNRLLSSSSQSQTSAAGSVPDARMSYQSDVVSKRSRSGSPGMEEEIVGSSGTTGGEFVLRGLGSLASAPSTGHPERDTHLQEQAAGNMGSSTLFAAPDSPSSCLLPDEHAAFFNELEYDNRERVPLCQAEEKELLFSRDEFVFCIKASPEAVARACANDFVMRDFDVFSADCRKIYDELIDHHKGAKASYIPQLQRQNEHWWGIACCTVDGQRLRYGDFAQQFCLQSCSKPITYGAVLEGVGVEDTHKHVGCEPSGMIFNALALDRNGLPHNPLINSGAIMCAGIYFAAAIEKKMELAKEEEMRLEEEELKCAEEIDEGSKNRFSENLVEDPLEAAGGGFPIDKANSCPLIGKKGQEKPREPAVEKEGNSSSCAQDHEFASCASSVVTFAATGVVASSPIKAGIASAEGPDAKQSSARGPQTASTGTLTKVDEEGVATEDETEESGTEFLDDKLESVVNGSRPKQASQDGKKKADFKTQRRHSTDDSKLIGALTKETAQKGCRRSAPKMPPKSVSAHSPIAGATATPAGSASPKAEFKQLSAPHLDHHHPHHLSAKTDDDEEVDVSDVPKIMREFIQKLSRDDKMSPSAIAEASGLNVAKIYAILKMGRKQDREQKTRRRQENRRREQYYATQGQEHNGQEEAPPHELPWYASTTEKCANLSHHHHDTPAGVPGRIFEPFAWEEAVECEEKEQEMQRLLCLDTALERETEVQEVIYVGNDGREHVRQKKLGRRRRSKELSARAPLGYAAGAGHAASSGNFFGNNKRAASPGSPQKGGLPLEQMNSPRLSTSSMGRSSNGSFDMSISGDVGSLNGSKAALVKLELDELEQVGSRAAGERPALSKGKAKSKESKQAAVAVAIGTTTGNGATSASTAPSAAGGALAPGQTITLKPGISSMSKGMKRAYASSPQMGAASARADGKTGFASSAKSTKTSGAADISPDTSPTTDFLPGGKLKEDHHSSDSLSPANRDQTPSTSATTDADDINTATVKIFPLPSSSANSSNAASSDEASKSPRSGGQLQVGQKTALITKSGTSTSGGTENASSLTATADPDPVGFVNTLSDYVEECLFEIQNMWSRLGGRRPVGYDEDVFHSEAKTADRNFALAYYLKEHRAFPDLINGTQCGRESLMNEVLDFYFQLCALTVDCETLAIAAATLANGGVCPTTCERVLKPVTVKHILSMMYSCGMYDYSGEFAFRIGLPAKSGVAGGVMVVVPNLLGFATFSPPLDKYGNSERGREFFARLTSVRPLHNFDITASSDQMMGTGGLWGGFGGGKQQAAVGIAGAGARELSSDGVTTVVAPADSGGLLAQPRSSDALSSAHPSSEANYHGGVTTTASTFSGQGLQNPSSALPSWLFEPKAHLIQLAAVGDLVSLNRMRLSGCREFYGEDYDRRTPLHLAASNGHLSVVRFLLDNGHPVDMVDRWGGTPLDDAVRENHLSVANFLERYMEGSFGGIWK
eukprot:g1693.t1